jgi:hypothetical protein
LRAASSRVLPTCPPNCPRCEAYSMNGPIRQRTAGSWELRAYLGVLPRRVADSTCRSPFEAPAATLNASWGKRSDPLRSGRRVALDDERAVRGMVRPAVDGWSPSTVRQNRPVLDCHPGQTVLPALAAPRDEDGRHGFGDALEF